MKHLRKLLVLFLSLLLTLSAVSGAVAGSGSNNGVVTPNLWSSEAIDDWYPVFALEAGRETGKSPTDGYAMEIKATTAKLEIVNNGIRELDVTVNGQRLNLNSFFDEGVGEATVDISPYIHYGQNAIDVQALGKPGETANLTVKAPAMNARILHMNDLHAQIDPLGKVAAYVNNARSAGGSVYFVNAGDNFSGNPVSDLNQGRPVIEVYNAMKLDAMAVGNHDFDNGPQETQARRSESTFPWLSANTAVVDQAATPIQPFEGTTVLTNELGQRIAFIGLTQTPPSTGKKNQVGLAFTDPVAAAQAEIDAVRDDVNLVVVLSHLGYDEDQDMAAVLTGADAILGAHSHTYLSKPKVVNGVPILQTGSNAKNLGDLVLRQAESVTYKGGADGGKYVVSTGSLTETDAEVQAIIDRWNAEMSVLLDEKLGYTATALDRDARYAMDVSIGNLITDGMRDQMGTEVAFYNNGGIRASIDAGDITWRDVYQVLPFGNFVMTFDLTGAQLMQVLEKSLRSDGGIDLQASGVNFTLYVDAAGAVDHVDAKVNGAPLDLNATYSVAVTDYVATSSWYNIVGMATPADISSAADAVLVGEFIRKLGTVAYAATEGRIGVEVIAAEPEFAVNFYNSSSLLASDTAGNIMPLTNQADVLIWAEDTAYQYERNSSEPKNFPMIDAGKPIPLAAIDQNLNGRVVGLGAVMFANGYKDYYQNAAWFANLLEYLGGKSGTVLFDDGHGQYYNQSKLTQIDAYLTGQGFTTAYTGANTTLTPEMLSGVKVLVITTPGDVGVYQPMDYIALMQWLTDGGRIILASQTDYGGYSNPAELNNLASFLAVDIRFNSDEVRDNDNNDGRNYSPVTNVFSEAYPDLTKER